MALILVMCFESDLKGYIYYRNVPGNVEYPITVLSGSPIFTKDGDVDVILGDQWVVDMGYVALGHVGFTGVVTTTRNAASAAEGTDLWTGVDIDFQYDTGSGYNGSWLDIRAPINLTAITGTVDGVKLKLRFTGNATQSNGQALTIHTTTTIQDQIDNLHPIDQFPATGNLSFTANLVSGGLGTYRLMYKAPPGVGNDYGESGAETVNDNSGLPIAGLITSAVIAFDYDYDRNNQAGFPAGTDRDIVLVGSNPGKAKHTVLDGVLTQTQGLSFSLVAQSDPSLHGLRMAITIDGPARLILLDGATTQSIREMYSRWVDWANSGDNQKYLPAFSVIADPPTIPVYATLENGWLVRPLGGDYTLTLTDGFLYDAGSGDPIAAVASGQEPRVRYEKPVVSSRVCCRIRTGRAPSG